MSIQKNQTSRPSGNARDRRQQRRFVAIQRVSTQPARQIGVRIPLYFGWELIIGANRVANRQTHIVGPFKTYRAFVTTVSVIIVVVVGLGVFYVNRSLRAATYTWTQSAWSTLTGNTAVHPTNQTSWAEYSAKDATMADGATVMMAPTDTTFSETNDTQFSAGTLSSTTVSGTGSAASVALTQGALTPPVASTSYLKAGSASINGQHYLAYDSGSNAVWGIRNSTSNIEKMPTDGSASTSYVPAAVTFTALAYVPSRSTLFATAGDGKIREISTADGTVTNTITPVTNATGDVVYDATNDFLYYVSTGGNVKKIRPDGTGEALCYNGNLTNYSRLLQLDPTNAVLYVGFTGEYTDSVVKITLPGCTGPTYTDYSASYIMGLAYDTATSSLWVANQSSTFSKLNGTTLVTTAEYYTIAAPFSIVYDSFQSVLWIGDHSTSPYRLYKVSPTDGSIIGTYTNMPAGFNSLITSLYEPTSNTLWLLGGSGTNFATRWVLTGFATSGTFTSLPLDTGGNLAYTTVAYNQTLPANTTLTVKVRSDSTSDMSGATAWNFCGALASGAVVTTANWNCVHAGERYVQYQVALGSTDPNVSPSLQDITLTYKTNDDGTLTSSPYDALDATNVLAKLQYSQTANGVIDTNIITDNFERADLGNNWYDHHYGPASGSTYSNICGSSDFCGAGNNFTFNVANYLTSSFNGDQFSEIVVSAAAADQHIGTVVRKTWGSGTVNYYSATTDGASFFRLNKTILDTPTVLLSLGAPYPTPGDTIRLEANGSTLNVYLNGSLRGTTTDTDQTSGHPGLYAYGNTGQPTGQAESWRGGNLTHVGGTLQFQLRTSPNGSSWTSWLGPTGAGDYYTDPAGSQAINSQHTDGLNDRYIQYKAYFSNTDHISTPVLTGVTTTYVVNAPPEFQAAPTAVQNVDGTVTISYTVRSPDTTTDTGSIGLVTPTFEYSLDNGSNWSAISSGLPGSATTPKAVESVNYTTYNAIWTAKTQLNGTYAAQAKIRVTVSDLQAANATAQSPTVAFALDVKNPVAGGTPIIVNASTNPATVTLSASDDSALQMCVTLDNTVANCAAYNTTTTITLVTDPDTVYVYFVDAAGNLVSANTVTPLTPSNLVIRDISNPPTNEFQLFTTWAASSLTIPQFGSYKVYVSSDGSSYSLLSTITDKTINYILHKPLADGDTRYYKVTTTDATGNISYFSSVISGVANGQGGGTDLTPPAISAATAGSITTQSAIITWDTDELSNSTVGFSTTAAVFTTEVGVATMLDNATGVGRHSVTLNNLNPGTLYYYRVKSTDPSGNVSTDTNGGDGYTFTTLNGPTISNVTTISVDNTTATISWQTNIAADSSVRYSTSATLASPTTVTVANPVTTHAVTLTGLTAGTKYYYEVASGVALDPNGGNYFTFTTTHDVDPPTISSIIVTPITDTQAVIVWATNERATGQIAYGTVAGNHPFSSAAVSTYNVNHAITLSGLGPNTTYTFVITSADSSGNSTTSVEQTFTTLDDLLTSAEAQALVDAATAAATDTAAPTLSVIEVKDITATSANVTWASNESANSFVKFGPSSADQVIYGNWVYSQTHSIPLLTLTANTTYTYTVVSADLHGNITSSPAATFTTAAVPASTLEEQLQAQIEDITQSAQDLPGPTISGQPTVQITPASATITWTTDKPASSLISYATASEYTPRKVYTQTVGDPDHYVTNHSVKIGNLSADTDYHYQIKSSTEVFQTSTTTDAVFHTPKLTFAIDNYSIDTPTTTTAIFRWTTNDTASASVLVTPYRDNVLVVDEQLSDVDDTRSFIHQISLDSLEPGIRYQVEMISVNTTGDRTSRLIPTFSTASTGQPPAITQIRIDSALSPGEKVKVQTIVSWNTDISSTSRVLYRAGVGRADEELPASTTLDSSYTKHHVVVITTFEPGAVYQLRVESKDSNGQVATSKALTTLTPQQERTVFQVITNTFQQVFGWTKVFNR